jgi:WXG100 family type VII secretion target
MSGQIRITPEQMRSRAGEYRTESSNVQDVISKMDTLLSNLKGEWEGASSEAYDARYQELRPGFVKAKELIEEIATALGNVATTLENADSQIASSLAG